MKKIINLCTALSLSFASFAQIDSTQNDKKSKIRNNESIEMSETDGVIMKNKTMMIVKNGKMTTMPSDYTCNNGTRIASNGRVTKKDGSQTMLKEGEYVDVCGKTLPLNNSKDPLDKNNSKTTKDRNMYLVPDSTLQKNK